MRMDPLTGVAARIGFGDVREYMGYRHAGGLHVARSDHGFAIVGARVEADDAIAGILAGGAFVQTSDGKLWCEGKGCDRFRCFVDGKTLANVDHPACAPMRVRAAP